MIPLSLAEVVRATGGTWHPAEGAAAAPTDVLVDGPVVTDSREVGPGGLYVARRGEHVDGHTFVTGARDHGAVASLTNRPVLGADCVVVTEDPERLSERPDRPPYDAVTRAFAALAREVRDRCAAAGGLRTVGITGSSGKTSTKDLMAQVVERLGPTLAPEASYNSEVGVPLTVCRLTEDITHLVAEMGASGAGHIAHLTAIAPPDVAVVLNVGTAHLGEFGSREAVGLAKSELVAALPAGGLAVLNADDPVVRAMAPVAGRAGARVLLVGTAEDADLRAEDVTLDDEGRPRFTVHAADTPDEGVPVALQLVGRHHVGNALAVAATAREWGMEWAQIAEALGAATARSRWRMEVTRRADGVTVVNDAYNANPESMRAALQALAGMARPGGRTVAVLGGMLELGADAPVEHRRLGELAAELGIDHLVTVGDLAEPAGTAYREAGGSRLTAVPDRDAARETLDAQLASGDVVLLKSSRDSGLRWLGDELAGASDRAGEDT